VNSKKSITLRTFKKYQPRQIAKFVRAFFNGRIFIVGLGRLRVIEGKVAAYQHQKNDKNFLVTVSEINSIINELSQPKVSAL
jgi:D-arabinose 5-phosphate isomerase GutQ